MMDMILNLFLLEFVIGLGIAVVWLGRIVYKEWED